MAVEHKNAAGTFPDRQHIETALSQLKAANFPMHNVSVVAQQGDSNEATLKPNLLVTAQSRELSMVL